MGSCIGSICFIGIVKGLSVGNGVFFFLLILYNWVFLNGDWFFWDFYKIILYFEYLFRYLI